MISKFPCQLSIVDLMICDRCGKREASIFIRREGAGESALCGECARKQGISAEDGSLRISLEDLFSPPPENPERPGYRTACPDCGTRLEEVRKSGRIGCPACFEAFRGDLIASLQRRGRRGAYRGSVPRRFAVRVRPAGAAASSGPDISLPQSSAMFLAGSGTREDLEGRLRDALGSEDYELAARLRDLLRSLETEAP